MRLAFVSPLPPAATGVADYAAELLGLLAARHAVDLFHGQGEVDDSRLPAGCAVLPAAELPARQRARPYDAVVHQLGNGPAHAFQYGLLSRVPGLLVLHDLVLFHSRAAMFLESEAVQAWRRDPASGAARDAARPALEAWRAELLYSYPAEGARLFEVHLGTVGDLLPYAYPLFRIPVEASRLVATHNGHAEAALRREVPAAEVARLPMLAAGVAVEAAAVSALRARLGFAAGDLVVGSYGLVTPEKRIEVVARAVAEVAGGGRRVRLLLVGPVPDAAALDALLARSGARPLAVVTGRVPLDELPLHMEAADLVAHLRYPGAGETSAALLRVLAQGRPAVVTDLEQQGEIPAKAVRRVDATDELRGLVRAIHELGEDDAARPRLGRHAAAWVRASHGPAAVSAAWEDALARCAALPDPPLRGWPAHWPRPDDA